MPFWRCEAPDCTQPPFSDIQQSDCPLCLGRFCKDHYEDTPNHPCWPYRSGYDRSPPESEIENNRMFSTLDMKIILAEASSLRGDRHTCTGPPQPFGPMLEEPNIMSGGINAHFMITFDDGVQWLVRMRQRRKAVTSSPEAAQLDMISDAATCVALHHGGAKVPMAWLRPISGKEPDDLFYFFVEYAPGKSYDPFSRIFRPEMDDELRQYVLQVAKFNLSLEKITFPKVGSLTFDENGKFTVGPRISSCPVYSRAPWYVGPYDTPKQYYLARNQASIEGALDGTKFRPSRTIMGYLIALEIRELLENDKEMDMEQGPWYVGHGEPRGDHFLFDDDGKLAGVVDWEGSYVSCKADAFRPPRWMPHNEYHTKGQNDPLGILEQLLAETYTQLGRHDMAQLIPKSRKYMRLSEFIGSPNYQYRGLNALRRTFLQQPDNIDGESKDWRERIAWAFERYKDDAGLQMLWTRHDWDPEHIPLHKIVRPTREE